MNIPISSWHIDVLVVVVLLISAIIGIKKGFLDRIIRFSSLVLVLLLAYKLHFLFLFLFQNIKITLNEPILDMLLLPILRKVLCFLVVFIVLMVIREILLFITLSLIKVITERVVITEWINKALGAFTNMASALINVYIVFIILSLPFFTNGAVIIKGSVSGNIIMSVGPDVSNSIVSVGQDMQELILNKDDGNHQNDKLKMGLSLMTMADTLGVLNKDMVTSFYESNYEDIEQVKKLEISKETYQRVIEIFDKFEIDQAVVQSIMNKLEVI